MGESKQTATQRPRAGDYWEFKLLGKPKRTKEVGRVNKVYGEKTNFGQLMRLIGRCDGAKCYAN